MEYSICIIGGGVTGCAIARTLSQYDCSVVLLERGNDVAIGASKANSGIIHGGYDDMPHSLKARFSHHGNALYDVWNEELSFGLRRIGSYVLAYSEQEMQQVQSLYERGIQNGVMHLEIHDGVKVRSHEPSIAEGVCGGLYCPQAGIVSPYEVVLAMAENAVANGVDIKLEHEVLGIKHDTRRGRGRDRLSDTQDGLVVLTSQGEITTRYVVNAAGLYADNIARMCGDEFFTITPRKGNYCIFERGYLPVSHILFRIPTKKGKGVLVTPTYHGNLLIGPDSYHVSSVRDSSVDEQGLEYIIANAKHSLPTLDTSRIITQFAGLRASAVHKDFIIDVSRNTRGVLHVAAIESPGLTSAPAIADYVSGLLLPHRGNGLRRSDFDPQRKQLIPSQNDRRYLSVEELHRAISLPAGNPDRIICRCEQITESIVREALNRSPAPLTIDAIKRRTRCGQGPCQGAFCRPRVKALLAEQSTITPQEVLCT